MWSSHQTLLQVSVVSFLEKIYYAITEPSCFIKYTVINWSFVCSSSFPRLSISRLENGENRVVSPNSQSSLTTSEVFVSCDHSKWFHGKAPFIYNTFTWLRLLFTNQSIFFRKMKHIWNNLFCFLQLFCIPDFSTLQFAVLITSLLYFWTRNSIIIITIQLVFFSSRNYSN